MTKIHMEPKWKDVKPDGYYVYLHRRKSDGTLFYVGKGKHRRAYDKDGRGKFWTYTANKHGVLVEIYKSGLSQECALTLEIILIGIFRDRGERLVNLAAGGDGSRGVPSTLKKKVYCSNGMDFESTECAADWVRKSLGTNATFSGISSAATGNNYTAYGLTWSYTPDVPEYITPEDRKRRAFSKPVRCSNGLVFPSLTESANWCKENVKPTANISKISLCCNGKRRKAYGLVWEYI